MDTLHPHRGVARFDVPGSPLVPYPYSVAGLASWSTAVMGPATAASGPAVAYLCGPGTDSVKGSS